MCSVVLTASHWGIPGFPLGNSRLGILEARSNPGFLFHSLWLLDSVSAARDIRRIAPFVTQEFLLQTLLPWCYLHKTLGAPRLCWGTWRPITLLVMLSPSPFLCPSSGHRFLRLNSSTLYSAELWSSKWEILRSRETWQKFWDYIHFFHLFF